VNIGGIELRDSGTDGTKEMKWGNEKYIQNLHKQFQSQTLEGRSIFEEMWS
jgi:hypothetical protein